jgi:4-hydroxy-3-polyprenylbenzoate decarboxylase
MKTLAGISSGYAANLLLRAADVCLKENRKVVLVPREMPLSQIHLRNLKEAAANGCIIIPPILTFYNAPQTLEDQINHVIGKVLMQFGIDYSQFVAWEGDGNYA